jgi:hypothetical protein
MQTTLNHPRTNLTATDHAPAAGTHGMRVLVTLFVLSLMIPSSWEIAGLRLDTARIYALCLVIPLAMRWLAQEAGRPLPVDTLILLHGFWIVVTMVVNHGPARIAFAGMNVVELLCGYLVGRILIRDPASFRFLFQALLMALIILLPFALFEMSNGRATLQEAFRSLFGSAHSDIDNPARWGLHRAQTVMQHPILWGVFCAIVVANVFFIWRDRLPAAVSRAGVAGLACFSSMSSGAVLNVLIQVLLIGWSWATNGAWKLLMVAFVSVYVFLSVASNRGPIVIMVETLTFSANTGWARIHIWRHGIDDVLANPIFGIGLHEHTRPFWLTVSVDNFWLVMMLRHGLIGFGLLAAALAWHIWKVTTAKGLSSYERRLREGYMIAFVALIFSLSTVHFWGPPYLLMFAYIGAGVWFYAGREGMPAPAVPAIGDADEDVPASADEAVIQDMPFARSFNDAKTPRRSLPNTRSSPAIDKLQQPPNVRVKLHSFSRRSDRHMDRKAP